MANQVLVLGAVLALTIALVSVSLHKIDEGEFAIHIQVFNLKILWLIASF